MLLKIACSTSLCRQYSLHLPLQVCLISLGRLNSQNASMHMTHKAFVQMTAIERRFLQPLLEVCFMCVVKSAPNESPRLAQTALTVEHLKK